MSFGKGLLGLGLLSAAGYGLYRLVTDDAPRAPAPAPQPQPAAPPPQPVRPQSAAKPSVVARVGADIAAIRRDLEAIKRRARDAAVKDRHFREGYLKGAQAVAARMPVPEVEIRNEADEDLANAFASDVEFGEIVDE